MGLTPDELGKEIGETLAGDWWAEANLRQKQVEVKKAYCYVSALYKITKVYFTVFY